MNKPAGVAPVKARRTRFIESIHLTKFSQLGLAEPIQRALAAKGYDEPTPIQAQAIPPLMDGRDLCGIAQTGTGKTAAFALPSLHHLSENPKPRPPQGCRMLVLSPTRELASQIAESFVAYGKFLRLSVATVFGGVPISRQIRQLQAGVDILVATPGRLLDLIDQRALNLRNVEIFVLDEADQMLDLGFIHALKRVDQMLPKKRQSLFFSATMPKTIAELGDRFLTDPVKVSVAPAATTAERVEQFATFVGQSEKTALLIMKIRSEPIDRALVFSRTKHGADRVVRNLIAAGIRAEAIHGNKSQPQRERALAQFRSGEIRILVATDIAARGIDVGGVSHVFNYELPNVAEQYVHRIGRTARAGATGIAIAFVADDERPYLRAIEKLTRIKLEMVPLPDNFLAEKAKLPAPVQPTGGGQRRHDDSRGGAGQRHGAGPEQTRRFAPRRPAGVGTHKGAVRKTSSR
ncbi:MAG: box helicase [Sphingomonas bacterium]|nr:box helicase [Sphingomonas bacterium]